MIYLIFITGWCVCGAFAGVVFLAASRRKLRVADVLLFAILTLGGPLGLLAVIAIDVWRGLVPHPHRWLSRMGPNREEVVVDKLGGDAQLGSLRVVGPERGRLEAWCRANWDQVPHARRRACLNYLRAWIPGDVLGKWKLQHLRGERIGWDVPGFHFFGGGMGIRNKLREVMLDAELPPVSSDFPLGEGSGGGQQPGPGCSNWDDFYTGALEELLEDEGPVAGTGKVYCILGGGGAFGIQTALYLLDHADPWRVVGIGRSPMRPAAFSLGVEEHRRYSYRQMHLVSDQDHLVGYLEELQPDVIINFAAQGEGAASWHDSWRFFDTNSTALCRLHEALEGREWFRDKCRFIHISTSELYGSVSVPAPEDYPIAASSPYSASKAAFDLYLLALRRSGRGLTSHILRPSNCYCPGQLLHRIIPRAMVAGLTGRRVPLHGGGSARKSYMHARDLARAIHLLVLHPESAPVYNVGPDAPVSIRDLAEMCADTCGLGLHDLFDVAPERVGQDACYWLDSSAIFRDLGWRPQVGLVEGLREVRDWAEQNLDLLRDWPTDYQLRA